VQALAFLQQDVHAVVNHLSDEETTTFRALQSHLFDKVSLSPTSLKESSDEDIEMTEVRDTPDSIRPTSGEGSRRSISGVPELEKDDEEGDTHPELTPELFRQRTLVFESLLQLINADAKQPSMDLTDLVDVLDKELL
jgi:muskelin